MLEIVPCGLLGGGGGDSPGALDANFRRRFNYQSRPLTWRESMGGLQRLLSDGQGTIGTHSATLMGCLSRALRPVVVGVRTNDVGVCGPITGVRDGSAGVRDIGTGSCFLVHREFLPETES